MKFDWSEKEPFSFLLGETRRVLWLISWIKHGLLATHLFAIENRNKQPIDFDKRNFLRILRTPKLSA